LSVEIVELFLKELSKETTGIIEKTTVFNLIQQISRLSHHAATVAVGCDIAQETSDSR